MANPLQGFIDSGAGIVVASSLHTIGAIVMLGGLVGYAVWARHLRHGDHQVGVLQLSAVAAYLAVFVNLIGGFMRTYQSDHPSLMLIGSNAWVQVLVVKHIILFAGMGLLVWLLESTAPRLLRAYRGKGEAPWGTSRVLSGLVGLSILIAAVLGAVTQVTPLGTEDDDGEAPPDPSAARSYQFDGQLTATPLSQDSATGTFDVPMGAEALDAALAWTPRQFTLTLRLAAPDGTVHEGTADNGRSTVHVEAAPAGTWRYEVASQASVQAAWNLAVLVMDADQAFLQDTVTVAPGAFYEINTEMQEGASFSWHWTSTAIVHFDVHTHFDGEVQYLVEEDAEAGEGNITAHRTGGYSLLWANEGTSPVQVTYHVEGSFTLHSIYA